jgi:hypothetical protein
MDYPILYLGFVRLVYKTEHKAMHNKGIAKTKADCLRLSKKCNEYFQ